MARPLSELTLEELWQLFPIILTEPNPEWTTWYADESARVREVLDGVDVELTHIGSTAIPGIWAKPTVDILAEVADAGQLDVVGKRLTENGYIEMSRSEGRISLNCGYTPEGFAERVFHLHLRVAGDRDEVFFKDYLRGHPEAAAEYEALKLELWRQFEHDRDGYTDAKGDLIARYTALAKDGL